MEKSGRSNSGKGEKDGTAIALHIDHIFQGISIAAAISSACIIDPASQAVRVDGKLCDLEIKQTSPGGENDVVTAKIILRDPDSGKVVREKFSTLFPAAWSKADIERAIREAYGYAKEHGGVERDGAFHGRARGIKIDGYLTDRGDAIATAFPVFQGSRRSLIRRGPAVNSLPFTFHRDKQGVARAVWSGGDAYGQPLCPVL